MVPPKHARLDLVGQHARNLLRLSKTIEPPVSAIRLAQIFAQFHWFTDKYETGECLAHDGICEVFLNKDLPPGRNNFNCAHELGQLVMNHLRIDQKKMDTHSINIIRQEADFFSVELLMSKWMMYKFADVTQEKSEKILYDLALLFDVPDEEMEKRLYELGIWEDEEKKFG